MASLAPGFNPLFAGLTLKDKAIFVVYEYRIGFNPLFAGLTLKAGRWSRLTPPN